MIDMADDSHTLDKYMDIFTACYSPWVEKHNACYDMVDLSIFWVRDTAKATRLTALHAYTTAREVRQYLEKIGGN